MLAGDRKAVGHGMSAAGLAILSLGLLCSSPVSAQSSETYRVDANSSKTVNLRLCGRQVTVRANGDNDTDLDYILMDENGRTVHEDVDETDLMITQVSNSAPCANYRLGVVNHGSVYNMMQVTLTTTQAWPNAGTADTKNRRVAIHNHTAEAFRAVQFSNTAATVWGENRLVAGNLEARTSRTFDMTDRTGACRFDVRVLTVSGQEYTRLNVDACAVATLEFGTEISH